MMKDLTYYLNLEYKYNLERISEEDGGGWLASIPLLEGCISDGETPTEAIVNLEDAKKEWISFCLDNGVTIPEPREDKFSGKFTLRVPKSTHKFLVNRADEEGISLNNLVNDLISKGIENKKINEEIETLLKNVSKSTPDTINITVNGVKNPMQIADSNRWRTQTKGTNFWKKRESSYFHQDISDNKDTFRLDHEFGVKL